MCELAGVPIDETLSKKQKLDENVVSIEATNQIPPTPKTDYELAFEYFNGNLNENEDDMNEGGDVTDDTYTYTLLNQNDEVVEVKAKNMDEANKKIISLHKGKDPMMTHVNGKLIDWENLKF